MSFYSTDTKEVLAQLQSSTQGLTSEEARQRLDKFGENKLIEEHKIKLIKLFLQQFQNSIVWILILAMIISGIAKEWTDFGVIGAIVVLNAILGFVQEFKAEKAIEALKKTLSPKAKVIRNNTEMIIDAILIVPGDILVLETGDKITADARIINLKNFEVQEASLTGESLPVKKELQIFPENTPLADRKNMVFAGTITTKGRAWAVVTETGMKTEIGKIAGMIHETKSPPTPLQKKLKHLSAFLAIAVILIALIIFGYGTFIAGNPLLEMLLAAIALAVAAIPEGLPAVVTISLAMGVQRMAKKHALIRKLPSAETLGACTVICSDKTGTLTHNEMTVTAIYTNREIINVSGSGYDPAGKFSKDPKNFEFFLTIGALNNNAQLNFDGEKWTVLGDPTEAALLVSAKKAGIDYQKLQQAYPRIEEIEFSSERKRMTTINQFKGKISLTKGAIDIILPLCNRILVNGQVERLTRQEKQRILQVNELMTKNALRVLGFAYKELTGIDAKGDIEKDLIFAGLQGMIDPPRIEVKEAITKCKQAGIKVVMVTGDHKGTAQAIAQQLGITGQALTGQELEQINNLEDYVEDISIYARVNPSHKVKIIDAFKAKKEVVAMTGDGVNDAPALKKADIGIAMGITGTDVAKEASAMVLADDNFTTIVNAVEEGRRIFDNIKKFVEYLLSSNMGEVLTVFVGILLKLPLPITALQILWINLITDGAPALALSVEPAEKEIMQKKPLKVEEKIVNRYRGFMILLIGMVMMTGTLFIFDSCLNQGLAYAQTMAFSTLMMFQMFNVLNQRSEESSVFKIGFFTNKWLLLAILSSIALQFAVVYVPFLQNLFGTVSLVAFDWIKVIGISASVLVFVEIVKFVKR